MTSDDRSRVQVLEAAHEAANARDRERLLAHLAEDVVWHGSGTGPLAGTHRGREAVWEHVLAPLLAAPVRIEDREVVEDGTYAVAFLDLVFDLGGDERRWKAIEVARIEQGLIVERSSFLSQQEEFDHFSSELQEAAAARG